MQILAILLSLAVTDQASTPQTTTTQTTTAAVQSTSPSPASATDTAAATAASDSTQPATTEAYWELIPGAEFDSHGTGYAFAGPGYVRPFRENTAFVARFFGNYLMYEFDDGAGTTKVRSPGASALAGIRFGGSSHFTIAGGLEGRRRNVNFEDFNGVEYADESDFEVGPVVQAETYLNPTSHNTIHGIVNYGAVDSYLWSRLAFKEQMTNRSWSGSNTMYLGVEGIGQGNEDIKSWQLGGFVELAHAPNGVSVMFRGGYKRSSFELAPDKDGPYVGIGLYKSFR